MNWTFRKPKIKGYYWLAAPTEFTPRIVDVYVVDGRWFVHTFESNTRWPLWRSWKACRWCGPLDAPLFLNSKMQVREEK